MSGAMMEEVAANPTSTANRNVVMFELGELTRNFIPPGDFASGGEATELPHYPGLTLPEFGLVPLPVTRLTANSIREQFEPASHGQVCDGVYNESARGCLQLDLSIATFTNEEWDYGIMDLASRVAVELGVHVDRQVEAVPTKMILYEPGCLFDEEHRYSERSEGTFATLVIQLPSACVGGHLKVEHEGHPFEFLGSSYANGPAAAQSNYAAFYVDCQHKKSEVTSGYQLTLIYDLCIITTVPAPPSLASNHLAVVRLADAIREAYALPSTPGNPRLAFLLEGHYDEEILVELGETVLMRGNDARLVAHLQRALAEEGKDGTRPPMQLHVCCLEKVKRHVRGNGSYYGSYDSDVERTEVKLVLKQSVLFPSEPHCRQCLCDYSTYGTASGLNLSYDERDWVIDVERQSDEYCDCVGRCDCEAWRQFSVSDESEGGGYNTPRTTTTTYQRSAVVLIRSTDAIVHIDRTTAITLVESAVESRTPHWEALLAAFSDSVPVNSCAVIARLFRLYVNLGRVDKADSFLEDKAPEVSTISLGSDHEPIIASPAAAETLVSVASADVARASAMLTRLLRATSTENGGTHAATLLANLGHVTSGVGGVGGDDGGGVYADFETQVVDEFILRTRGGNWKGLEPLLEFFLKDAAPRPSHFRRLMMALLESEYGEYHKIFHRRETVQLLLSVAKTDAARASAMVARLLRSTSRFEGGTNAAKFLMVLRGVAGFVAMDTNVAAADGDVYASVAKQIADEFVRRARNHCQYYWADREADLLELFSADPALGAAEHAHLLLDGIRGVEGSIEMILASPATAKALVSVATTDPARASKILEPLLLCVKFRSLRNAEHRVYLAVLSRGSPLRKTAQPKLASAFLDNVRREIDDNGDNGDSNGDGDGNGDGLYALFAKQAASVDSLTSIGTPGSGWVSSDIWGNEAYLLKLFSLDPAVDKADHARMLLAVLGTRAGASPEIFMSRATAEALVSLYTSDAPRASTMLALLLRDTNYGTLPVVFLKHVRDIAGGGRVYRRFAEQVADELVHRMGHLDGYGGAWGDESALLGLFLVDPALAGLADRTRRQVTRPGYFEDEQHLDCFIESQEPEKDGRKRRKLRR